MATSSTTRDSVLELQKESGDATDMIQQDLVESTTDELFNELKTEKLSNIDDTFIDASETNDTTVSCVQKSDAIERPKQDIISQLSPAMINALFEKPYDRQFIINIESLIVNFIDSNDTNLNLNPMNSYYRLLSHQIAQYHNLKHILKKFNTTTSNVDNSFLVLYKPTREDTLELNSKNSKEADIPLVISPTLPLLKDLVLPSSSPNSDNTSNTVSNSSDLPTGSSSSSNNNATSFTTSSKKFKILKRQNSSNTNISGNSTDTNDTTTDTIIPNSNNATITNDNTTTELSSSSQTLNNTANSLELQRMEKEKNYEKLKQKIFDSNNKLINSSFNTLESENNNLTAGAHSSSPQPFDFETSRFKDQLNEDEYYCRNNTNTNNNNVNSTNVDKKINNTNASTSQINTSANSTLDSSSNNSTFSLNNYSDISTTPISINNSNSNNSSNSNTIITTGHNNSTTNNMHNNNVNITTNITNNNNASSSNNNKNNNINNSYHHKYKKRYNNKIKNLNYMNNTMNNNGVPLMPYSPQGYAPVYQMSMSPYSNSPTQQQQQQQMQMQQHLSNNFYSTNKNNVNSNSIHPYYPSNYNYPNSNPNIYNNGSNSNSNVHNNNSGNYSYPFIIPYYNNVNVGMNYMYPTNMVPPPQFAMIPPPYPMAIPHPMPYPPPPGPNNYSAPYLNSNGNGNGNSMNTQRMKTIKDSRQYNNATFTANANNNNGSDISTDEQVDKLSNDFKDLSA
ncbi:hypothetical protein TBLA_0F02080 [Henningerozyma blattae CBS 6284]|uniref:R3H domain-containing protein n=1 Tax=Henningerozyma blattae (strain ATCC 34711 / CBS 6284 / DSM 70876 / NBRC 10599 / NRRL Y-10934 / UCD 77-7) TaxID=1071380 RepID=I2H5U8_HENB6|nr:hypothetical protein TBLA_0F02080 [Tetrapisispora blattae CBS 6284]CCH61750.1 hypothetical protein TBLA_0F02080 [Tetrapisispora blattae CBS 6284]